MDIRRKPGLQELNFIEWLDYYSIARILILTKIDKLSKTKQIKQRLLIEKDLGENNNGLILFSAKSRHGKDAVWDAVDRLIQISP